MASSNTCPICQGQGKIPTPDGKQWQACPLCEGTGTWTGPGREFHYTATFVLTANQHLGAQAIAQVNDYDFKWMFAMATSTGNFTAKVYSASDKRGFSNVEVHSSLLWGTAQNPFPMLAPYIFPRAGQILVDLTDISGAGNTIFLDLNGVELG
jgi:hypothetical protein